MLKILFTNILFRIPGYCSLFGFKSKFIWMIHPLNLQDIYRRYKILKILPEEVLFFLLKFLPPLVLSRVDGIIDENNNNINGYIFGCFLTSKMIANNKELVYKKILKGIKLGHRLGVDIFCMGGMLSVDKDTELEIMSKYSIYLNNGSCLLSDVILQRITSILNNIGKDFQDISIGVVNATSFKGKIISKYLSLNNFKYINLIGRDYQHLEDLSLEINKDNINIFDNLEHIKNCDLVIIAPALGRLEFVDDCFKNDFIVCDVNTPPYNYNILQKQYQNLIVFKDELINTECVKYYYDLGISKNNSYICLAETFLLSKLINNKESFYNDLSMEKVKKVAELFKKSGFFLIKK